MSLTSSDSHGVVSSVFLGGIMPFLCRIWDSLVCGHIDMALSKISACHQDKCLFPAQRDANSFWQSLGGCMSGIDLQALNPGSNPWDKDTLWKTTSHMDQKTNGNSPLLCGNTTALLIFTGFASLVRLCLGLGLLWGLIQRELGMNQSLANRLPLTFLCFSYCPLRILAKKPLCHGTRL